MGRIKNIGVFHCDVLFEWEKDKTKREDRNDLCFSSVCFGRKIKKVEG